MGTQCADHTSPGENQSSKPNNSMNNHNKPTEISIKKTGALLNGYVMLG